MLYLYRFAVGYLRVIFYGDFCEKILDLTAKNRITLWDSRLTKKGIESSVTVRDFRLLKSIIKKSGIRVHILKKKGLPFKLNRNRKRTGLFVGGVFFLCFLQIMSGHIWIIDVEGNNYVKSEEILSHCSEIGIETGIKKNKINPKQQREELLLKTDEIAWASLNIEGSKLTVNVSEVERVQKNTDAYNIKASHDGIIKKIDVTSGTCVVKIGDVVKAGDLLVSGVVEESGSTKFVNSVGSIFAETVNEINLEEKFTRTVTDYSGKTEKRYVLEVFSLKIPLYLGSVKEDYSTKLKKYPLKLFETNMPVCLYEREFIFHTKDVITSNEEELKLLLEERALKKIKEEKYESYEKVSQEFTKTKDGLKLSTKFKTLENIAQKDEMLISDKE